MCMSHYEEDEFDIAARQRGTGGAHRRAESTWRRFLPLLVILVVAPLLAWGVMSLLTKDRDSAAPSPTETVSTPAEGEQSQAPAEEEQTTAAPSEEPSEAPSEEPSEEPDAEDVNYDAPIVVLNGAGINQLAAQVAEVLTAEGFTAVQPSNYDRELPTVSTIFYHSEAEKGAAEAISQKLGISELVESAEATQSIAIVLRDNPLP